MESNVDCGSEGTVKDFLASLKNTRWGATASEKTIDRIFNCALDIQETFSQEEKKTVRDELIKKYPNINFKKSMELLVESLIQNQHLSDHLTLYAIKKYTLLNSRTDFCEILDSLLGEVKLRECLFQLNQELADVDLDLFRINNFLSEVVNGTDSGRVFNSLNTQTSVVLNAAKHGSLLGAQTLVDEMISCLESQSDLRLWFMMIKNDNSQILLELCGMYNDLFESLLKFFDKFANEIESNYDEELNVKYSHVNLDFDEFVNVFKLFLNDKKIGKAVSDYLNGKDLSDKNFCFWIDVKTCIEL